MEEAHKMKFEQLTSDNWNKLCDIWNDPEHKANRTKIKSNHFMGSKPFVAARAEIFYILLETSMTIDEIVDDVLGTKSGYIKGLGYGPKPNTTRATESRTTELEDSLEKAKLEAASAQNELQK
ncbi:hypothetical protein BC332_31663 [Capsicum chinense]|nr:hypothetical protein BC332_31663 [Capsicum chinense]